MSRYRDAKITVEQCFQFDIQSLKYDLKRVDHENSISSMREWRDPLGRLEAVLGYWIGRMSGEGLIVLVDPERTSLFPSSVRLLAEYEIKVETIPTRIGGLRYWFHCPVENDRKPCGRRVKKLFLPPGENVFGCRHCHDLTYRTCQMHDKRKTALARDPDLLDEALSSEDRRRVFLGVQALPLAVREMQKRGW